MRHGRVVVAAAYAFGLAKNHGYVDGNKRVDFTAAVTFLAVNGVEFLVDEHEAVLVMESLCEDEIDEETLAIWFSENSTVSDE